MGKKQVKFYLQKGEFMNFYRLDVLLDPVNENLALFVCFLFYVALALLCFGAKFIPGKPVHKVNMKIFPETGS